MHGQYNGSQQVICPGAEDMTSKDSSLRIHEQFDDPFDLAFGDGALIFAERNAGGAILYVVLLKLLLGFADMCERRTTILCDYPSLPFDPELFSASCSRNARTSDSSGRNPSLEGFFSYIENAFYAGLFECITFVWGRM
jgi:hypothetical protein